MLGSVKLTHDHFEIKIVLWNLLSRLRNRFDGGGLVATGSVVVRVYKHSAFERCEMNLKLTCWLLLAQKSPGTESHFD